ncbi:uncharacterized protein [Amphiura filiformis]|uniref:uncharacterized protein n=1 Tax=Amphiura filiformis TaxID=82378 RepID=UPI003B216319
MLSGDININPGPYAPKYPCGVCNKAVKWKQQAIECEGCSVWYHKQCLNMSDEVFEALQNHVSYTWICTACGIPNFASSLFDFTDSFDLSNPFDPLAASPDTSMDSLNLENLELRDVHHPTSSPKRSVSQRSKAKQKSKCKPIKFLNINCQSVKAKNYRFLVMLDTENPDVITGTESWLNSNIATGEVIPSCYQVFRNDRSGGDSHGGVFIAVKDNLIANEETDLMTETESLWVSIRMQGMTPMYVGVFYRSQVTNTDYVKQLDSALSKIPPQASVWLLGDFNLPDVDWEIFKFKPGGRYAGPSKAMLEIALDFNLHQQVKEPTRLDSILDLCFTNSPSFVESVVVIPGISDHEAVIVNASVKPKLVRPVKRKIFLYKKAKFDDIGDKIKSFDEKLTPDYINAKTVNELVTEFNQVILNSMDEFVPSKMTSSRWKLPWINNSIKKDICKKKRLFNKARNMAPQLPGMPSNIFVDKQTVKSVKQSESMFMISSAVV